MQARETLAISLASQKRCILFRDVVRSRSARQQGSGVCNRCVLCPPAPPMSSPVSRGLIALGSPCEKRVAPVCSTTPWGRHQVRRGLEGRRARPKSSFQRCDGNELSAPDRPICSRSVPSEEKELVLQRAREICSGSCICFFIIQLFPRYILHISLSRLCFPIGGSLQRNIVGE